MNSGAQGTVYALISFFTIHKWDYANRRLNVKPLGESSQSRGDDPETTKYDAFVDEVNESWRIRQDKHLHET